MDHSNAGFRTTSGEIDVAAGDDIEEEWSDESTAVYRPSPQRDERDAWVHGRSLDVVFERAKQQGACLPTDFIFLHAQACAELAGSGRRSRVPKEDRHREPELCPSRIFVQFDGDLKLDWEAADPTVSTGERARSYLSPERLRGLPSNGRSDLYSLALVMAELFVLKRLSDGGGSITESEGGTDFAELLRNGTRIPRELGSLLLRSLAVDFDQRPFGVTSFLVDLERVGHKLGFRADPSITAAYMRNLFFESLPPPEAFPEPPDEHGSLRIFDALSPPAPPLQLLPAPIEPPTTPTQGPPREASPRPQESEMPPALARTLPPVLPPESGQRSSSGQNAKWGPLRPWMFLLGGGLAGVAVFSFLRAGPSQVFTAAAGHWGEPLTNAVMFVDGTQRCTGARCTFNLAPGVHEVSVRADGYAPQLQLVAVRASEPAALNFRLERGGSVLKVSGQPMSALLFVDGDPAGRLPLEVELAPGPHRLRIEAEHFLAHERDVALSLGETKRLDDIALQPLAGKASPDVQAPDAPTRDETTSEAPVAARTRLSAAVRASRASAARAPDGDAPADPLRAAMQRVIARDTAAAKAGTGVDPSGVKSTTTANDPCWVSFNTIPRSNVFVDNVRVGTTPVLKWRLRPGPHTVQFVDVDTKTVKAFACKPGEIKVIALKLNR